MAPRTGQRQEVVFCGGVWGGVADALMGKVSLQAEAGGPHRGENAT